MSPQRGGEVYIDAPFEQFSKRMEKPVVNRLFSYGKSIGYKLRYSSSGQGTVEYVALIMLVAALLAGVVGATGNTDSIKQIPESIAKKMKGAIEAVELKG